MGSSLVFIGIGVVLYIVVFGVMLNLASAILGSVFNALDTVVEQMNVEGAWLQNYRDINETSQFLLLMIMSLGVVLIVLKTIMAASARGAD